MKYVSGISLALLLLDLLRSPDVTAQECLANASIPRPVTVSYDAHRAHLSAVVFQPGPDGTLRAIDSSSHREIWRFTPVELDVTHRTDGLMSQLRILRFDANLDGTLDPAAGDRLLIFFGMRRGGRFYYALDATDRERVQVLWRAGPDNLPGIGETWSDPVTARIRIAGTAQNGEHLVVIIGGGYDELEDSAHRIYFLDAMNGHLLWYAGGPRGIEAPSPPDLPLDGMTSPLPGHIAVVDLDGDGFADRLYAGDTGGRLWRFDIWNGESGARLVTGGILANLGADTSGARADARRFFNGPDIALMQRSSFDPYYNVAIGSGDRAHPFSRETHDRLYSIRDHRPFVKLLQASYDTFPAVLDADLVDITGHVATAEVPASAPGWKLELRTGGVWLGEKSLAEPLTINGAILFTTFEPAPDSDCADSARNRVYALRVEEGNPTSDLNDDGQITESDAAVELQQHGIAGEVELKAPASSSGEPPQPPEDPEGNAHHDTQCGVGDETLQFCASMERLQRTFWQRKAPPD